MDAANTSQVDFMELRTRAEFLEICGDVERAAELRELSLQIGREVDLTCYAYQLMWRNRVDDAIALAEVNVAAHPESWNVYDTLGEAYEMKGDLRSAAENYHRATELVEHEEQRQRIEGSLRRLTRLERAAS